MNADIATAQTIERLTPLADVLARMGEIAPVAAQALPLADASGRVLAEEVVAAAAIPAVARAARDGWAVVAETTRDAGPYAPMLLQPPAQRIDAFATLPAGTDAVAPIDAVTAIAGMMQVMAPVAPGEAVLATGGDAQAGTTLAKAGRRLRAIDIAALAAASIATVRVRVPHVRIAIARPDDALLQSIAAFVAAAARHAGARVESDDTLDAAFRGAGDAVIGIGGTGSGRSDRSVTALKRAGTKICHGIGLAPGETTAFGNVQTRPVLLIPGRLDAALASWVTLGRALIARLSGECVEDVASEATLSRKITSTIGMVEIVPVRREGDAVVPLASGLLPLQTLTQADGWIRVPADSEGCPAGTLVQVRPLP